MYGERGIQTWREIVCLDEGEDIKRFMFPAILCERSESKSDKCEMMSTRCEETGK